MIAISYMENQSFSERIDNPTKQLESSIVYWNISKQQSPKAEIKLWSPVDITTFEIQPGNPSFVVAGGYNGQIVIYNKNADSLQMTTAGDRDLITLKYRAISPPDSSHKGPICDIKFLPASLIEKRVKGKKHFDFD